MYLFRFYKYVPTLYQNNLAANTNRTINVSNGPYTYQYASEALGYMKLLELKRQQY